MMAVENSVERFQISFARLCVAEIVPVSMLPVTILGDAANSLAQAICI